VPSTREALRAYARQAKNKQLEVAPGPGTPVRPALEPGERMRERGGASGVCHLRRWIALFATLSVVPAWAQERPVNVTTGAGYLSLCGGPAAAPIGCTTYPHGIEKGVRAVMRHTPQPLVCFSPGADLTKNIDIFWKYLKSHPDRLSEDTADLYLAALVEAYPCSQKLPPADKRF
jgi:hypothetical protein